MLCFVKEVGRDDWMDGYKSAMSGEWVTVYHPVAFAYTPRKPRSSVCPDTLYTACGRARLLIRQNCCECSES